jgi:ribosome-associated protein YbcJ (S4-like RNA binding protein)
VVIPFFVVVERTIIEKRGEKIVESDEVRFQSRKFFS